MYVVPVEFDQVFFDWAAEALEEEWQLGVASGQWSVCSSAAPNQVNFMRQVSCATDGLDISTDVLDISTDAPPSDISADTLENDIQIDHSCEPVVSKPRSFDVGKRHSTAPQLQTPPSSPRFSEEGLGRLFDGIRRHLGVLAVRRSRRLSLRRSAQVRQTMRVQEADEVVEMIRQATEVVIWGDRYNSSLFDLFCERRMLTCFVETLCTRESPSVVSAQLLQSLLMLVQNARRETSFFYLLSATEQSGAGGLFNMLFTNPPNLNDEEVLPYFVSFLKALALRLDSDSAGLCLTRGLSGAGTTAAVGTPAHRLPIFDRAVLLASHSDAMVRTAARTAILQLLRLQLSSVSDATEDSFRRDLAPTLARMLRAAWAENEGGFKGFRDACAGPRSRGFAVEEDQNLRGFVRDLLALRVPTVSAALESHLTEEHIQWAMLEHSSDLRRLEGNYT